MTDSTDRGRRGIAFFGPDDAKRLEETDAMSFPEIPADASDDFFAWALSGGHIVKVLFREEPTEGREGMSLLWSWFGPDHPLPRHSHDGDCLYYVLSGEAHLGNRVVGAGAGFFVPAGAPYAYTAGPEGIQILEFRGVRTFDMVINESNERWAKLAAVAREHTDAWQAEGAAHA